MLSFSSKNQYILLFTKKRSFPEIRFQLNKQKSSKKIKFIELSKMNLTIVTYFYLQQPTKIQQKEKNLFFNLSMSILSQSTHQNRGPLIAVIKIQLDEENVDRIFLHLKDDDQLLAEEFVQKHGLNSMLKKHIYQRIQMSRQAVREQDGQQQQDLISQSPSSDSFTTPIQKRQPKEQSSRKPYNPQISNQPNYEQKLPVSKHLAQKYNLDQQISQRNFNPLRKSQPKFQQKETYIAYTDSDENSVNAKKNDFIVQYDKSQKEIKLPEKFKQTLFETSDYQIKDRSTKQADSSLYSYQNRYKNVYDVSGLKLKSSYPSIKHQNSLSFQRHHTEEQYASSQSSQGLFQKQISNKKEQYLQTVPIDRNYNLANRNNNYQHKLTQIKNEERKLKYQYLNDPQTNSRGQIWNKNQQSKDFNVVSEDNYIKPSHQTFNYHNVSQNNATRRFDDIQFDQLFVKIPQRNHYRQENDKNRFSSFERSSASDLNELNYISFNKPSIELPSGIMHKNSSIEQGDSSHSYDDNLLKNFQNSLKKVGSIRSNNKIADESNRSKDRQSLQKINDQQSTTRFSQQRMFKDIKQISTKLQQNRQMNEQQTDRPSKVKFYNKEQLKSLRQSGMSRSMSRTQISKINKQVTSRLYNEADIKKKYIETLKARAKNIRQEQNQELQEVTHKPHINMMSKMLAENRIKDSKKLEDHLLEQGKAVQLKRQQMINRQARKQLEQCSFQPQINQKSHKLNDLRRSKSKSKISAHDHSEIRCSKVWPNQVTFHPEINKLSSEIARNKGSFDQRQQAFLEQRNSKMFQKLQQKLQIQKTDPVSGQRLYQPQLTQRSQKLARQSNQKNRQNKPIHSYLYDLSKVTPPTIVLNPTPTINPESQKLFNQLQQKRLTWLFLQLDSDQDGVISNTKICIDQIPTQMLEIIAPVLYEMEELNTELNMEDFKMAMKNLVKGLDPWQKSVLYHYGKSSKGIRT